jgi:hypothetical protein
MAWSTTRCDFLIFCNSALRDAVTTEEHARLVSTILVKCLRSPADPTTLEGPDKIIVEDGKVRYLQYMTEDQLVVAKQAVARSVLSIMPAFDTLAKETGVAA